MMGRRAVEDLRKLPKTSIREKLDERRDPGFYLGKRLWAVFMQPQIRRAEGAQQPRPDRALMVGGIAFGNAAAIYRPELRIFWRQRAQTVRREQFSLNHGKD